MRTRSSLEYTIPRRRNRRRSRHQQEAIPIVDKYPIQMADDRPMAEQLQAPTGGFESAIVVPPINAQNFELKYLSISCSIFEFFEESFSEAAMGAFQGKLRNEMNEMKNIMKALTPASVKAVEDRCVPCGSNHNGSSCPLTRGAYDYPVYHDNFQQFQQAAAVGGFVQGNSGNIGEITMLYLVYFATVTLFLSEEWNAKGLPPVVVLLLMTFTPMPPPICLTTDNEEAKETRPFLRTARTLIDVFGEEMSLRTDEERLIISVRSKELKYTTRPHKESVFEKHEVKTCNLSREISSICPSIKERLNFWKNKEVLEKNEILKRNNTCDFQIPSSSFGKKEVGGEKNLDVKTIVSFFAPIGNCVRKWATNEFVKDNVEINHEVFKRDNENVLGVHENEEEEIAFLDGLLENENFFEMNDKKVESLERKTKEDFETKDEPKSKKELQVFHPDIEILNHFEITSYVGSDYVFYEDFNLVDMLFPNDIRVSYLDPGDNIS
ncbi:hypothetical protein Tco_1326499 [Tanacetum coccineum]